MSLLFFTEDLIALALATILLVNLLVTLTFGFLLICLQDLSLRFGVPEERFRDFLLRLERMGEPGLCAGVGVESSWTLGFGIGSCTGEVETSQGC